MPNLARKFILIIAVFGVLLAAVMGVGGYFDQSAMNWLEPTKPAPLGKSDLAVIFWSGDMGARVGLGSQILEQLTASGFPVLSVTSPALFANPRDRAFVDSQVAKSVNLALSRRGIRRVAIVGESFGADVLGAGLGQLPPKLRQRVASVVLLVPATSVYFAANPIGIFYHGPIAADPEHTIPLLHGLPVTCIYGTGEQDSLCRAPVMAGAKRVSIDDGHMMLFHSEEAVSAAIAGVATAPAPFR